MNLWVGSGADWQSAQPVTFDKGRGINSYQWSPGGTHLLYLQDVGGDENWRLYALEIATGLVRSLTPFARCRVGFYTLSYLHPDECVVGLNQRNPNFSDVWKVNILTGELSYLMQNDEYAEVMVNQDFQIRATSKNTADGGIQFFRSTEGGEWVPFLEVPAEDAMIFGTLGILENGDILAVSSLGRDMGALVSFDLATGWETVLGLDLRADIDHCLTDPMTKTPLAFSANRLTNEWQVLDETLAEDFALLSALPGEFSISSQSRDNRKWIIFNNRTDRPATYLLYDRDNRELTELFNVRPDLDGLPLRPMHPVEIPARDGLSLVSYYTLPAGKDGSEIPSGPVPLVLLVHGGPWARDAYGFNGIHQWLANRGYAVLSVNYRGSTGFGKNFVNAANGQFAGTMHDDLIDAVDWAIAQGITERDTVAIMGGSYGGYATLVGLTFTPDRFAAGIDIVGPSNLVTLIESFPAYWKPFMESTWFSRVGNPDKPADRERLLAQSPITRVKDIRSPLLIGQGANDPRVIQAESDQIVQVMESARLPVTYVLFPDEGHGFARPENRMAFYAVAENFLAEVFGREAEPIGGSFQGSSTQIPHGASFVTGLEAALAGHSPVVKQ
jgi:dipeptidyl aminopeptidase/acylaminoacyl peptidase